MYKHTVYTMIVRVWKEESQTYRRVLVNHYIVMSAAMLLTVKPILTTPLNKGNAG